MARAMSRRRLKQEVAWAQEAIADGPRVTGDDRPSGAVARRIEGEGAKA